MKKSVLPYNERSGLTPCWRGSSRNSLSLQFFYRFVRHRHSPALSLLFSLKHTSERYAFLVRTPSRFERRSPRHPPRPRIHSGCLRLYRTKAIGHRRRLQMEPPRPPSGNSVQNGANGSPGKNSQPSVFGMPYITRGYPQPALLQQRNVGEPHCSLLLRLFGAVPFSTWQNLPATTAGLESNRTNTKTHAHAHV